MAPGHARGATGTEDGEEKHQGPAGKGRWELLLCKFRDRQTERESRKGGASCLQRVGGKPPLHAALRCRTMLLSHGARFPRDRFPKKARCLSDALAFSALLVFPLQAHEAAALRRRARARGDNLQTTAEQSPEQGIQPAQGIQQLRNGSGAS